MTALVCFGWIGLLLGLAVAPAAKTVSDSPAKTEPLRRVNSPQIKSTCRNPDAEGNIMSDVELRRRFFYTK